MTDRAEQARAEAERQIHVYGDDFKARTLRANLNDAFVQGVEWADANHPTAEALARVRQLHQKSGTWARLPRWARETEADAEPYRFCVECRDRWPCDTYTVTEVEV